jgi:hypothetical protein
MFLDRFLLTSIYTFVEYLRCTFVIEYEELNFTQIIT